MHPTRLTLRLMPMTTTDFSCERCGNCCRIPGEVRLLTGEPEKIAALLGISTDAFIQNHTRLTRDRIGLSIMERQDHRCSMLDTRGCRIEEAKPYQCRAFPLDWNYDGWERICLAADRGGPAFAEATEGRQKSEAGGRRAPRPDRTI